MEKSITNKIIEFLKANVELHTVPQRRTFLYQAIPDYHRLCGDINFEGSANVFLSLLIEKLVNYSIHNPGEDLIIAVLEKVRPDVGKNDQDTCDELLQEWGVFCQKRRSSDTNDVEREDYEHDIFLSYGEDYEFWVNDPFLPEFRRLLENFLERRPKILPVRQSEIWSQELKMKLLRSRCIVPIWYPSRFESSWWIHECSIMLQRETQLRELYPESSIRLILPVIVCDCKKFPELTRNIPEQFKLDNIHDFIVPGTALKDCRRYIDFRNTMERWVEIAVSETIKQTSWREEWLNNTGITIPQEPISTSNQSKQTFYAIWGRGHG